VNVIKLFFSEHLCLWWGFVRTQRLPPPGSAPGLCDTTDDELFNNVVRQSNHVLHALLPPPSSASQRYNLRHGAHTLQLPEHSTLLFDSNFLTRMLYKNTY